MNLIIKSFTSITPSKTRVERTYRNVKRKIITSSFSRWKASRKYIINNIKYPIRTSSSRFNSNKKCSVVFDTRRFSSRTHRSGIIQRRWSIGR